jgi:hypothetical protein
MRTPLSLFIFAGLALGPSVGALGQTPVTPQFFAFIDDPGGVGPFQTADVGNPDGKNYLLTQVVHADAIGDHVNPVDPVAAANALVAKILAGFATSPNPEAVVAGKLGIAIDGLGHQFPALATGLIRDPQDRLEGTRLGFAGQINDDMLPVFNPLYPTKFTYLHHPFLYNATASASDTASLAHWVSAFVGQYRYRQTHPLPNEHAIPDPTWCLLDCEVNPISYVTDQNTVWMIWWLAQNNRQNGTGPRTWDDMTVPGWGTMTLHQIYSQRADYYGLPADLPDGTLGILRSDLGIRNDLPGDHERNRRFILFWEEVNLRSRDACLSQVYGLVHDAWGHVDPMDPNSPWKVRCSNYADAHYDGALATTGYFQDWPDPDHPVLDQYGHPAARTVPTNLFPRSLFYDYQQDYLWGSSFRPNNQGPVSTGVWTAVVETTSADADATVTYGTGPNILWYDDTTPCGWYRHRQSNLNMPRALYDSGRCRFDTPTTNPPGPVLRDETRLASSLRLGLETVEGAINSGVLSSEPSGMHEARVWNWSPMAFRQEGGNPFEADNESGALLSQEELLQFLSRVQRAKNLPGGPVWTGYIPGMSSAGDYMHIWDSTVEALHRTYACDVVGFKRSAGVKPAWSDDWDGPNGDHRYALAFTTWTRKPAPSNAVVYPTVDLEAPDTASPMTSLDVTVDVPQPYAGDSLLIHFDTGCNTPATNPPTIGTDPWLTAGTVYAFDNNPGLGGQPKGWTLLPVLVQEPTAADRFQDQSLLEGSYGFYTPRAEHWGDAAHTYATAHRTALIGGPFGAVCGTSGCCHDGVSGPVGGFVLQDPSSGHYYLKLRFIHKISSAVATKLISRYDLVTVVPFRPPFCTQGSAMWAGAPVAQSDINYDGQIGAPDLIQFIGQYADGTPGADMNQDGAVDPQDFINFLAHYGNGD